MSAPVMRDEEPATLKKPVHLAVERVRRDSLNSSTESVGKTSSVDFDTAMDLAGYGNFNYLLLLLAIPATWSCCFDSTSISIVLPVAGCQLGMTSPTEYGALNSSFYAGMMCSALLWGLLSDSYGRQRLLSAGFLLDALLVVASAFAGSFWSMAVLRFLSGFVIFGPYTIFLTYLAEVSCSKYRDMAVVFSGLFFALGCIVQPAIALAIVPLEMSIQLPLDLKINSWRLFLIVCALPSLVAGLGTAFCVESPKFLLDQGRKDEALKVFRRIYTINTGQMATSYPVCKLHLSKLQSGSGALGRPTGKLGSVLARALQQTVSMFKWPYLSASIFSCGLQFLLTSVVDVFRLWLPQLFSEMLSPTAELTGNSTLCSILTAKGQEEDFKPNCLESGIDAEVYTNIMMIYTVVFITTAFTSAMVNFINKRIILIITAALSSTCIVLIPFLNTSYVLPLAGFFIALLNSYFYVHIAVVVEIYPTKLRATGVSMAYLACRIGTLVSSLAFTGLLYFNCKLVFYIFGTILVGMTVGSCFVPKPAEEDEQTKSGSQYNINNTTTTTTTVPQTNINTPSLPQP